MCKLLVDPFRLRSWFVDLVDGEHHRYIGRLSVVDGLDRLRHHGVIRRDDDDRKVGQLCSTCAHGGERLVTRGVQKCDSSAVRKLHVVGADVLRDASRLTGDDIGFTNIVEQRGLTMVNVSHHRDDRRPWNKVFLAVNLLAATLDLLGQVGRDKLYLVAELLGDKHKGLRVKPLVDGHHHAELHASLDHLVDRSVVHKGGEVVGGHKLGDLENFLLGYLLCHLLLGLGGRLFPLLLSVLGSEVVLLVVVHPGVGLLDLLLDFLLHRLLLLLGHDRLEAIRSAVALLSALALLLCLPGVLVLVLAGTVVRLLAFLGHIDLLTALGDSFPLLVAFLRLELGQVYLSKNLEPWSGAFGGRFLFISLRLALWMLLVFGLGLFLFLSGSRRKFLFVLAHRPFTATDVLSCSRGCRLRNGFLGSLDFLDLRLRLRFTLGHLHFRFLRWSFLYRSLSRLWLDLGLRLRLFHRLGHRSLHDRFRLRLWLDLRLWLRHNRPDGLWFRLWLHRSEDGCLYDSLPDWLVLFLFGAFLLLLGGLLQNLVEFDVNFFRSLLELQILSELLFDSREMFV